MSAPLSKSAAKKLESQRRHAAWMKAHYEGIRARRRRTMSALASALLALDRAREKIDLYDQKVRSSDESVFRAILKLNEVYPLLGHKAHP